MTYNEIVTGTPPAMTVRFNGATSKGTVSAGTISGKTVTYTYKITSGDNGVLSVYSLEGTSLTDAVGNKASNTKPALTGNTVTADTIAPTCQLVPTITNKCRTASFEVTGYDVNLLEYSFDKETYSSDNIDCEPYYESHSIFKKTAWVKDSAGNIGSCSYIYRNEDDRNCDYVRTCEVGYKWNSELCRCSLIYN